MSIKDIFKAGVPIDRVFTFRASRCWGTGTLEAKGPIAPRPVRLSDAREFPVHLAHGVPVVDWMGLLQRKQPAGLAAVKFNMPEDGYVSLQVRAKDGTVVRQLVNGEFYGKGAHEVRWDGLSTPIWRTARRACPSRRLHVAGHLPQGHRVAVPRLRLQRRRHALGLSARPGQLGRRPWSARSARPAMRTRCTWDGRAQEAGKALLACDLEGRPVWNNIHGGIAGDTNGCGRRRPGLCAP